MPVGSIDGNSPQHEHYDSLVERWLATCPSSSSSQLDPTVGTRSNIPPEVPPSNLSYMPTDRRPWQNEMSMLQARPDQAIAGRPFGVLGAFPTLREQQKFKSQRGESHLKITSTDPLSFGPFHASKDSQMIGLTDKSTTISDAYFSWPDSSDSFTAVNPRHTLATSTPSPDLEAFQGDEMVPNRESASSSPEGDSYWEADIDTHPSITPGTSFSQDSSVSSWIESSAFNNTWFGSNQASRAHFHCQYSRSQYEPTRNDIGIASQTVSEFEVVNPSSSWSRSEKSLSNFDIPDIPKSVPLDYQLTMDLADLGLTPTTTTGRLGEDIPLANDASIVSKPTTYDYFKRVRTGASALGQNDCQTLRPSDIWEQPADLHASELPSLGTDLEIRSLDPLGMAQIPATTTVPCFSQEPVHDTGSKADNHSIMSTSDSCSQSQCKESCSNYRRSNSGSRRRACDDFLVRSKLAGMSYRDIRVQGHFTEAESTLRGRFRTLTKRKEQRVRKPQWHEKDVRHFSLIQPPTHHTFSICIDFNSLACPRSSSSSKPLTKLWRASRTLHSIRKYL